MIRPRGKASRIYEKIFSLDSKPEKKNRRKNHRRDDVRNRLDKRDDELISRDYSLNDRPRNP